MARAPYRPVELTEALRPVAQPVDTFVTAQVPSRDTNLQDLARSLSGLGGALGGLVGQRDKEAEEAEKVRAEAQFWSDNGVGSAEAVSRGLIPANASPNFLRSYKRLEGEVAGGVLEKKFASAYDAWDQKSSTDPQAFNGFLQGFLKENIKTTDADILRGLMPKVDQIRHNYLQRQIGDAGRATMDGFVTTMGARSNQVIDDADTAGLASKTGTDYGRLFGELETIREGGLKTGANREKVDQGLVDTITSAAIMKRDPKLLDFLKRKVPGQDYAWEDTPYGRTQKRETIDKLEAIGRRSIQDDEKKRREEKAELKDSVTRDTIAAITKDPRAPLPEELLARGEKVDADFRVNVIRWRDTIGKQGQTSDPEDLLAVTSDILNGGGLQRVQRAMQEKVFKNSEDLTRAWKLAEGMKAEGPKLDEMLRVGTAKTIVDTLKKQTATEKDASKIMFDDGSMSREGLQATSDYKQALMQWLLENPNANTLEREKAAQTIGATFLDRLKQPEGPMSATYYDREGLGSPNTFSANAPPKQMPEAGQGSGPEATTTAPKPPAKPDTPWAPTPMPETDAAGSPIGGTQMTTDPGSRPEHKRSTYDGAAAWFKQLSPESKAVVERKAAQSGIDVRQASQILHQQALDAGLIVSDDDPTPVARPKPAPAQPPAPPVQTAPAPGRQSSTAPGSMPTARAPDGTPIETASTSDFRDDTRQIMDAFARAVGPAVSREQAAKAPRIEGGAPATPIPASLITEKGPTPVPANAAVAVVDDGPRGHINHGVISLKGPDGQILGQYRFVNGGGGAGTIPHGAYDVTNFRDAASRKAQGLSNLGDTFDLSEVFDARAGRTRTALRIHQVHGEGTLGCIGIQGGDAAWQDFSRKMQGLLSQGGGKYTLVLGSETDGGGSGRAGSSQGAFERALSSTAKPAGTFASPEVQADPRAARILDMVSGAELNPANAGNYNAVYGNAAATEDLSRRTLDQTIAWSRNRGTASSATGRFQFMAETLEDLKKDLKLSGSEPFSPALQDRMALALLNRRGYRDWTTGKLTDEAFAANLAKEWASLPNPATGQSHYAGDGRNRALVSPSQVRAALTGTGAFPAARLEQAAQTLTSETARPGFMSRLRGMFGGGSASPALTTAPTSDAYSQAPSPDLAARLRRVNPDPLAHSDSVLADVAAPLAAAIRKAREENPKLRIVVVARSGEGAEVFPVDAEGRVSFDPAQQDAVGAAIRRSATQLGFGVNISGGTGGGRTHFELAPTTRT